MESRAQRAIGERGQAVPLMVLVVAIGLVGIIVVGRLGLSADDAARARTAADAAALAGAADGRAAAVSIAAANAGVLLEFHEVANGVEVVVRVGNASARARAEVFVSWQPASAVTGTVRPRSGP